MDMAQTHQMRPPGETRWYAPARDISCCAPDIIRAALEEWEDHPDAGKWNDEDVARACEALAAFCSQECVVDSDTVGEAFTMSGLGAVHPVLMQHMYALIGQQFMSVFWVGIRGATSTNPEGEFELVQYDPRVLAESAQQMTKLMRMAPWKRWFYLKWDSTRKYLITKLRGESE